MTLGSLPSLWTSWALSWDCNTLPVLLLPPQSVWRRRPLPIPAPTIPDMPLHAALPQACPTGPLQGDDVQNGDLGRALRSALEAGLGAVGAGISSVGVTAGTVQLSTPSSSGTAALTTYSIVSVRGTRCGRVYRWLAGLLSSPGLLCKCRCTLSDLCSCRPRRPAHAEHDRCGLLCARLHSRPM